MPKNWVEFSLGLMTANLRLIAAVLIVLTIGRPASLCAELSAAAKVFQKRLYEAIGAEWRPRLQAHANELDVGIVHVALTLTGGGKISDLRVVSNTSNQRFAELSLDSIKHAKIPAPPPDLLEHGRFKIDLTFDIYPNKPNQSMKPTAPWRYNLSVFATTPCRGLSLSR
jgi:hypothetical protein